MTEQERRAVVAAQRGIWDAISALTGATPRLAEQTQAVRETLKRMDLLLDEALAAAGAG